MKRFKMLTAALCAVVLLCGFSVTAYAGGGEEFADGTGGADLWEGLGWVFGPRAEVLKRLSGPPHQHCWRRSCCRCSFFNSPLFFRSDSSHGWVLRAAHFRALSELSARALWLAKNRY